MPAVPTSKVKTFEQGLSELSSSAYQRLRNKPQFKAAVAAAAAAARQPIPDWATGNTLQSQDPASRGEKRQGSLTLRTREEEAKGRSLQPAGCRRDKRNAGSSAIAAHQPLSEEAVFDVNHEPKGGKLAETVHKRSRKRPRAVATSVGSRGQLPAATAFDEGKGKSCHSCGSGHLGAGAVVWMPWTKDYWPAQVAPLHSSISTCFSPNHSFWHHLVLVVSFHEYQRQHMTKSCSWKRIGLKYQRKGWSLQ
jgi:hypothetical protein